MIDLSAVVAGTIDDIVDYNAGNTSRILGREYVAYGEPYWRLKLEYLWDEWVLGRMAWLEDSDGVRVVRFDGPSPHPRWLSYAGSLPTFSTPSPAPANLPK